MSGIGLTRWLGLVLALGTTIAAAPALAQKPAAPGTRVAVLVGANAAAPGRRPLLYSHHDVERMAAVLLDVGGFHKGDVFTLKDPSPQTLLRALESAADRLRDAPESLLYFFYSGHADETSIYPGGHPVPLARVRTLIDQAKVSVRIGVVDACRGGSWTRAKGLVADEPFAVKWPVSLDSEGSVLIASSSGQESAHESDDLQGSYFTFHFAGGLRGAADRNADGMVSLSEGFEYAKERTIRDTLRHTREAQRPSYAVNLRGRRDLVLSRVAASASTLNVDQQEGPLELIHASSGLQLLELPPGPRKVKLAVPPGVYLVRKRLEHGNLVRDVKVEAGVTSTIAEEQLTLVGNADLAVAAKGVAEPARRPLPRPLFIVSEIDRRDQSPPAGVTGSKPAPVAASAIASAPVPAWLQVGAVSTGVAAVLSAALTWKFMGDVRSYDKELDAYRRFPCRGVPTDVRCDRTGTVLLSPLTPSHLAHRDSLRGEGKRFENLQMWGSITTVVTGALSVYLFSRWWGHP